MKRAPKLSRPDSESRSLPVNLQSSITSTGRNVVDRGQVEFRRKHSPTSVPIAPYKMKLPPNSSSATIIMPGRVEGFAKPARDGGQSTRRILGLITYLVGIAKSVSATNTPKHPETKNQRLSRLTPNPTATMIARQIKNRSQRIGSSLSYRSYPNHCRGPSWSCG